MADDRVKISALDSASTMDTGDLFPVTQDRGGALKTNKATMSQIATEVVNGIEYTTALDTDDKKPLGAINELLDRIIGLYPVRTFSATPIATLTDGAENVPMKSLIVDIVPKQASGTPTPSSPLPISGSDAVVITHTGKNLFSFDKAIADADNANVYLTPEGYIRFITNANRIKYNIKSSNVVTFTATVASGSSASNAIRFIAYYTDGTNSVIASVTTTDTNDHVISGSSASGKTICGIQSAWTDGVVTYLKQAQLEAGTTATTYEPYTGTIYPISWQTEAGTVYGGWYDITTGKLTVTHERYNLGTLSWTLNANGFWQANKPDDMARCNASEVPQVIAEKYQMQTGTWIYGHGSTYGYFGMNGGLIYITDENTPSSYIVAPLATPIEYTLTPTQIKTRGGTESIWSDTGDVEGEYRADIQAYIDGLVNNGGNRSLNKSLELTKTTEKTEEPEETEEPKEEEKK